MTQELIAKELQLADVVQLHDGPWGTAIVKQIKDNEVTFFRPYGHANEFSYTGGVICYIGIEVFSQPITDHAIHKHNATFKVLERKALK